MMMLSNRIMQLLACIAAISLFSSVMYLYASEETASERTLEQLSEFKKDGFVNIRGERRGYLEDSGNLKQRIKLFAKQEYLAIIAGDEEVKSIKMTIKDKKGKKTILESSTAGPVATLKYVPKKKAKYSFFVEVMGSGGYYQFSLVTK